jgi:hypothetical protein
MRRLLSPSAVAVALDPAGAARFGAGTPSRSQPDELHALWRDAGLAGVDVGEQDVGADYDGFRSSFLSASAGPALNATPSTRPAGTCCAMRCGAASAHHRGYRLTARAGYTHGLSPV